MYALQAQVCSTRCLVLEGASEHGTYTYMQGATLWL